MNFQKASKVFVFIMVLPLLYRSAQASDLNQQELINKIVQRATENEQQMENYGFDINMMVRWLKRDGVVKKTETRNYRTSWIDDRRHLGLYRINERPLNFAQRKEAEKSKKEWQKALHNGKKSALSPKLPFTWTELMQKYDFTLDPTDKTNSYVLNFKHKKVKLPERTRVEKVLNHLDGRLWVDQEFRIVKVQGHLSDGISFGFGLVKVNSLDLEYNQRSYGNLALPASMQLNLKVKALFVYAEGRQIMGTFENFHLNPMIEARTTSPLIDYAPSK